jgi:transposase
MFEFYRDVPRLIVPDNLKSAVNKASFYDPEINRSYGMMAAHYGTCVVPARPRRARDKAKVEAGVRIAQTYILGRLRHQTFFSLNEENTAIKLAVERVNDHVMRRLGVNRRALFLNVEKPALEPLPPTQYEYAEWKLARVAPDYHIEVDNFLYSVPHTLLHEQVDVRVTSRVIEVFHRAMRVAVHHRRYQGSRAGTLPEHMPSNHRFVAEWSPARFQRWARSFGPNTEALVVAVLAARRHPEQAFRTSLGILKLFRGLQTARVEAVAARALAVGALTYKSVASILQNNLDRASPAAESASVLDHTNVRGPNYFH